MLALGAGLLEKLLAADTGYLGPRVDRGNGHDAEFVTYQTKRVDTVLGRIMPRRASYRAYYHCRACQRGVAPRDDELGLTGASLSPGLGGMTALAATAEPFAKAAGLLADLAGVSLSTKRVQRSAEADGTPAEQYTRAESRAIANRGVSVLPPARLPDKLSGAIDGTGVPMVPAATHDRPGKGPDRRARTREVKLACLFPQTRQDAKGRPARDPDSSSYLGTFAPAEEFATLVHTEAPRRGAEHIRQLIVLGDGTHWICKPRHPHPARSHPNRGPLPRPRTPARPRQTACPRPRRQPARLAASPTRGPLAAATSKPSSTPAEQVPLSNPDHIAERHTALGYFTTNAQRMRYAYFRELGMFIGSGALEAGCKAVIGQRMKLSGMRWNIPGATSILTLRCHQASDRWEHIWTRPAQPDPAALIA